MSVTGGCHRVPLMPGSLGRNQCNSAVCNRSRCSQMCVLLDACVVGGEQEDLTGSHDQGRAG